MKPGWLVTFCLTLMPLTPVSADVYRWVDDDGGLHFSDRALAPGAEAMARPGAVNRVPAVTTASAGQPGTASGRRSAPRQADPAQRARQQRTCDDYLKRLDRIQSQLRAGYSNAKGNRLRAQRRSLSERYHRECRNL